MQVTARCGPLQAVSWEGEGAQMEGLFMWDYGYLVLAGRTGMHQVPSIGISWMKERSGTSLC